MKSMGKIRIAIADDHKIVRVGLNGILTMEADLEVTGEAEDGQQLMQLLKEKPVDVILMDIDMGYSNGIDTTEQVKLQYPHIQIIALTVHEEEDLIIKMLEAGANGYLLKSCGKEELVAAIHAVMKGDSYFSHNVSTTLLKALSNYKNRSYSHHPNDGPLTEREKEILKLIAQEFSNPEIAGKLFLSVRTVDTHRRNIMEKLQAKNTAGLVKYALEKGMI